MAAKKEKIFFCAELFFASAAVLFTWLLVRHQQPAISYPFVKRVLFSLFYPFFFGAKWINGGVIFAAVLTIYITCRRTQTGGTFFRQAWMGCLVSILSVPLCFFIVITKTGFIDTWLPSCRCLQAVCFLVLELNLTGITGWLQEKGRKTAANDLLFPSWVYPCAPIFLMISWLPVILAGRYVFPQGDDFDYSAFCHRAWMNGQGLPGVLREAGAQVAESFLEWQGTFSSIFLMSLQPGIWNIKLYHLVPLLLTLLPTTGVFLFFYALFHKTCGASRKETFFIASCVCIMVIQLVPAKAPAFFWYNGAIHYMGAFSFLLYFLSFLLLACHAQKSKWRYILPAAVSGILVGGGNLVSGLAGCIVIGYLIIFFWYLKKKTHLKIVLASGCTLLAAFLANVLAPGNRVRDMSTPQEVNYGAIRSILESFRFSFLQSTGEFIDWYILLFLLISAPILWSIARKCDFHFPLPGLISAGSFCLLSAMYTPQLYAVGEWRLGRIQDIIYFAYVLLLTLNEFYLFGWIQRQKEAEAGFFLSPRTFYALTAAGLVITGLLTVGTPQKVTSAAVLDAVRTGEAQRYAACIQHNINLLETTEDACVQVEKPPRTPTIFVDEEIEPWRCGTAEFFGKEKVYYPDEAE